MRLQVHTVVDVAAGLLRRWVRHVLLRAAKIVAKAERVHKVVGRAAAAVDVHLARVKLVKAARDLLALRLHLRRLLGILRIGSIALGLRLGLLLALGLGGGGIGGLELLGRHHATRAALRLECLRLLGEEVAGVGHEELGAILRAGDAALLQLEQARLDLVLHIVQLHELCDLVRRRPRSGRRRVGVVERRLEQDLLDGLERVGRALLEHSDERALNVRLQVHTVVDVAAAIRNVHTTNTRRRTRDRPNLLTKALHTNLEECLKINVDGRCRELELKRLEDLRMDRTKCPYRHTRLLQIDLRASTL